MNQNDSYKGKTKCLLAVREPNSRANRADIPVDVSDEEVWGQKRGRNWAGRKTGKTSIREKDRVKAGWRESRKSVAGKRGRGRGERAKWLSTAATRQRSPSSRMMDAFMNDPTESRTSLLLPPSSFSYFIFTFLDRRKSANLWVIRPLCRVDPHRVRRGLGAYRTIPREPPAAYIAQDGLFPFTPPSFSIAIRFDVVVSYSAEKWAEWLFHTEYTHAALAFLASLKRILKFIRAPCAVRGFLSLRE